MVHILIAIVDILILMFLMLLTESLCRKDVPVKIFTLFTGKQKKNFVENKISWNFGKGIEMSIEEDNPTKEIKFYFRKKNL